MSRKFNFTIFALLAAATLTSCLKDNDTDSTVYEDTAITQLVMGTLNRYTQTTSAATGNDTVVKSTFSGSVYPLTIDQLNRRIYNQKELPIGTDVSHVVFTTAAAKNGGSIALLSAGGDSLMWVSTKDSLDFSTQRTLRVYNSNLTRWREYTMVLSVSSSTGLTFGWQRVGTIEGADLENSKLMAWNDSVRLVGQGTVCQGTVAYRLGSDGRVESSVDLDSWTPTTDEAPQPALAQLLGAATTELYALGTDGRLKVSRDGQGAKWTDEQLDDAATLLPDAQIAMVSWPYSPVDQADYVLLAGQNSRYANASHATMWRKISIAGEDGTWVYMTPNASNFRQLPLQSHPSLVYYDDAVLCIDDSLQLLQSQDQGITWWTADDYNTLPALLKGERVSMVADSQQRLWLLAKGELWMGRRQ